MLVSFVIRSPEVQKVLQGKSPDPASALQTFNSHKIPSNLLISFLFALVFRHNA